MILVAKQSLVSIYMHHGNNHDHRPVLKYPGALRYMIMTRLLMIQCPKWSKVATLFKGSGKFASRGKIASCYFAIWRQNSPYGYFAANAKLAVSFMLTQKLTQTLNSNPNPNPKPSPLTQKLTQTLTLILTLIPSLAQTLTQTLIQTKEKHYFASRGKIATFTHEKGLYWRN